MIHIAGTVRVREVAAAEEAIRALVAASRAEDGCIEYSLCFDLLDPNLVWINERWETMEALGAHSKTEHYKAWGAKAAGLGISDSSIRLYTEEPKDL